MQTENKISIKAAASQKKKINLSRREYATVVIILLVFIFAAVLKPELFTGARLGEMVTSILLWMPLIVTVAMGMLLVICLGDIDISVGSIIGFVGMSVGFLFRDYNIPIPVAFLIAAGMGLACGALNGFLISYINIPSMIVTLATLNIFRGFAMIVGDSYQIMSDQIPAELGAFVTHGFLGIPWLSWMAIFLVIIMIFVMRYTHFGREVYAVGGNREAARLRGINVKKVRMVVFMLVGMFAGIAAVMYGARYGMYHALTTGQSFEFVVISATVIGGASMNGGTGSVVGTLLGSLLLGSIQTLIPMCGLSGYYYQAIYGLIIIIALIIDRVIESRQAAAAVAEV